MKRVRSTCTWALAGLLLAVLGGAHLPHGTAHATNCDVVVELLQRGIPEGEIAHATGLSMNEIFACVGGPVQAAPPEAYFPGGASAGPAPRGAAGPPTRGAAGAPPLGAAGPAPLGAAGPPPRAATGLPPLGAAGGRPAR